MRRAKERGSALIDLIFGGYIGMLLMLMILHAIAAIHVGRLAHLEGARLAAGAKALQSLFNNHGATIVASGMADGFATPYAPTTAELKDAGYMPRYLNVALPFGGTMQFTVRRNAENDLIGLACDSKSFTKAGQAAPDIAAKVMAASSGLGLMTSAAGPATLNGAVITNVVSPISGPAVVCAWAFLPDPA